MYWRQLCTRAFLYKIKRKFIQDKNLVNWVAHWIRFILFRCVLFIQASHAVWRLAYRARIFNSAVSRTQSVDWISRISTAVSNDLSKKADPNEYETELLTSNLTPKTLFERWDQATKVQHPDRASWCLARNWSLLDRKSCAQSLVWFAQKLSYLFSNWSLVRFQGELVEEVTLSGLYCFILEWLLNLYFKEHVDTWVWFKGLVLRPRHVPKEDHRDVWKGKLGRKRPQKRSIHFIRLHTWKLSIYWFGV